MVENDAFYMLSYVGPNVGGATSTLASGAIRYLTSRGYRDTRCLDAEFGDTRNGFWTPDWTPAGRQPHVYMHSRVVNASAAKRFPQTLDMGVDTCNNIINIKSEDKTPKNKLFKF
ncbi:uncharacterized protein LOC120321506 isoform X2 [Drosophila yakuba]|uniref:uncharacterized protein LOC120321506 isoform X2 n=1 Tax=Drosophila yakuba TaxID=7245 RepID=UPI0019308093|nr:uncharacterized protein LOC120321506 isoform X2 [Drosophila yakuba]